MKNRINYVLVLVSLSLMPGLWGCEKKTNIDPQPQPLSQDQERPESTRQYDRMVHNAELSDMALADIHFLPNRSQLNSNGTYRLNHLAWLVDRYGGKILLDMEQPKSRLTKARARTVVSYLKSWGLPESKIHVAVALPPTKGMEAKEAILIYDNTRYKPCDKKKKLLP